MRVIHEKYHPNGFKIFLASKLNGIQLDSSTLAKVRNGAELQIHDPHHLQFDFEPNAAVLKMFGHRNSLVDVQWLEWENELQEVLIPYLQCIATGKDDRILGDILTSELQFLNSSLPSSNSFFFNGVPSATDVVLFGALLPLTNSSKSMKLLESQTKLMHYMLFLRSQLEFKEAVVNYFGSDTVPLLPWAIQQTTFPSSKHCTWNLLKLQESTAKLSVEAGRSSGQSSINEDRAATDSEVNEAKLYWEKDVPKKELGKSKPHPILPVKGEKNIMVTSALPYVNNVPHLGNIIGCVLSADCFVRFSRIRGDNIIYICGTDEYGTATETKALAEGCTPQEICDKYHAIHAEVYKWFNIAFDFFGRTTTNSQTVAAQSIFWHLHQNNKITQNTVEQLFCGKCERFLADRFVEGTCPFPGCGYEDARGDQCDGCGKLVNATDLVKPRCKLCSHTPSLKGSTHLFLNLPLIEDELQQWLQATSPQWTSNAKVICESWLRDGLKERCITRDLKWGTPVPLEGFTDKVFYVWYDAPIGYVSMTMEYCGSDWEMWWKDPDNVSYYQFMAKDNVPFHGVIFPSCQIGTKDAWTKVTHLIATEYLNYEDGKFSKSRGVGVFGDQAKETGITSDIWRFYLLYVRPEAHDTVFSWFDLQTKNNSELLNNLGNFVNRSLKFVFQFYDGIIPEASPNDYDFKVMAYINQELDKYTKALDSCRLRDGIRHMLSITRIGNQYIQENEPYKLIKPDRSKDDKSRGATIINISANIVALVAVLLQPFMPDTSKCILNFLNNPQTLNALPAAIAQFVKSGHKINEPTPLIRKITDEEIEVLRSRFAGIPNSGEVKQKKAPEEKSSSPSLNKEVPAVVGDPAEIQRLENSVAEQASKVRELKTQGVTKDVLAVEIEQLLKLKEQLSIAQGIDPATVRSTGKKNKKK